MKTKLITLLFLIPLFNNAQSLIDVVETAVEINGFKEELLYYGFAEGDKLIISFEENNNLPVKEFEVIEYPSTSRFKDIKVTKFTNKTITINKTGVYIFRILNSDDNSRICKIKLQRIPLTENLKHFNTSVSWKTAIDTSYSNTYEKVSVADTIIKNVIEETSKVSSKTAINGNPNHTWVNFYLPDNTVSWSFYIGVNKDGKKEYEEASSKFFAKAAGSAMLIPGYGPLAALALTGVSYFSTVPSGSNVKYYFLDSENYTNFIQNRKNYSFKSGDVINGFAQMKNPLSGKIFLYLINDNLRNAISVFIKVTAITIKESYKNRSTKEAKFEEKKIPYLEKY